MKKGIFITLNHSIHNAFTLNETNIDKSKRITATTTVAAGAIEVVEIEEEKKNENVMRSISKIMPMILEMITI